MKKRSDGKGYKTEVTDGRKYAETALTDTQKAELLLGDADPLTPLATALKNAGLSTSSSKRLLRRLRAECMEPKQQIREVKTRGILRKIEDIIDRSLDYMDDWNLSQSSARDLAVIVGVMLDKRQLLRGEPTAILSIDDRQSMSKLIPALLEEAQRRGMFAQVIDGEVIEAEVTPATVPKEPRTGLTGIRDRVTFAEQEKMDEIGEPRGLQDGEENDDG